MSEDFRKITYVFSPLVLVGLIDLVLRTHSWASLTTSMLWALSCLAIGGAIGFLFGIPRTLQTDRPVNGPGSLVGYRQQVNTNLEQISDWLTKIIVGVGLIQIRNVTPYLYRLAETLAAGMGSVDDHLAFAFALIVYFLVIGFLFGYLSTRLFLAGAFSRADQTSIVIREVKSLAKGLRPEELKQVLLKARPEAFIKGEASFREEGMAESEEEILGDEAEEDENEPAILEQDLERLRKRE